MWNSVALGEVISISTTSLRMAKGSFGNSVAVGEATSKSSDSRDPALEGDRENSKLVALGERSPNESPIVVLL